MLPDSFNHYFIKLNSVHKYNSKQKQRNEFFQFRIYSQSGRKTTSYLFKCEESCPNKILPLSVINV